MELKLVWGTVIRYSYAWLLWQKKQRAPQSYKNHMILQEKPIIFTKALIFT